MPLQQVMTRRQMLIHGMVTLCFAVLLALSGGGACAGEVYVWMEAEWLDGVSGVIAQGAALPEGAKAWRYVMPARALAAEAAPSAGGSITTAGGGARATRALDVPLSGAYRVWLRYVQRRDQHTPVRVLIEQRGKTAFSGAFGGTLSVYPWDELLLRQGWTFAWHGRDAELSAGPATVILSAAGPGVRQVDCLLLTTDPNYEPHNDEPPPYDYLKYLAAPRRRAGLKQLVATQADHAIPGAWRRLARGTRPFWRNTQPLPGGAKERRQVPPGPAFDEPLSARSLPGAKLSAGMARRAALEEVRKALASRFKDEWAVLFPGKAAGREHRAVVFPPADQLALVHPACEWGASRIGLTLSADPMRLAMQTAFGRGASRQYGIRWIGCPAGEAEAALPLGALRRALYYQYMSGADLACFKRRLDRLVAETPRGQIAPARRLADELIDLVHRHPDRGVAYTPAAILLDDAHLWSPRRRGNPRPLGVLSSPTKGDRMITAIMNVLYPPPRLRGRALAGGYMGDLFDIVAASPSHRGDLSAYRVVVAAGDVHFDAEWAKKLEAYVHAGGTLVLNVAHLRDAFAQTLLGLTRTRQTLSSSLARCEIDRAVFPSAPFTYEHVIPTGCDVLATSVAGDPLITSNKAGRGRVVLVLIPYALGRDGQCSPIFAHLLDHLVAGQVPVSVVGGDVQWLVNRTRRGWVVTLLAAAAQDGRDTDNPVEAALACTVPVWESVDWFNDEAVVWEERPDGTSRATRR